MGSSVSQEVCRIQYNTTLQCGVGFDKITQKFYVKDLQPEEFEPNPDIAGDGVSGGSFPHTFLIENSYLDRYCMPSLWYRPWLWL
jgi:hypothetical protein